MQGEIAEILSGPDYFRCERNHTRMRKIACLERQEEGIPVGIGYKREMPSECADCPQGREIKAGLGGKDQSTEDSMKRKIGICSECKKEKEIAARGMCKKCYDTWRRKELAKHRSYSLAIMGVNYGEEISVAEESEDTIGAEDSIDMIESAGSVESTTAGETWIIVDFEHLPELFDSLRQRAAQELRTPEQQALYFIREALHDQ